MNELAKHIEALLLENDCVIVPDLGGFVAYYTPAVRVEEEDAFLPPTRVIGFNPRMKMNDGALVQSYMTVYATSFSDATKMIGRQVDEVLDRLHEDGKVELPNIGELRYSIYGTYDFIPYDNKLATPSLYALGSFQMKQLSALRQEREEATRTLAPQQAGEHTAAQVPSVGRRYRLPRRIHWGQAVAVVAVIALLFMFSVPVENTEITRENYARLFPEQLFEKMEKQSVAFADMPVCQQPSAAVQQDKRTKARKPIAVKEVKVGQPGSDSKSHAVASSAVATPSDKRTPAPAAASKPAAGKAAGTEKPASPTAKPAKETAKPAKETAKPATTPDAGASQKRYHIIVASVGTEADARRMAEELKKQGYSGAQALIGGGKMRVSIQSLPTEKEAYQVLSGIRQNEKYKSAWVLKN